MKIEGDIVLFTTNDPFFWLEADGSKPYTVRIVTQREYYLLTNRKLEKIQVTRGIGLEKEFFERDILSIIPLAVFLGMVLVGIAWIHEGEKDTPEQ